MSKSRWRRERENRRQAGRMKKPAGHQNHRSVNRIAEMSRGGRWPSAQTKQAAKAAMRAWRHGSTRNLRDGRCAAFVRREISSCRPAERSSKSISRLLAMCDVFYLTRGAAEMACALGVSSISVARKIATTERAPNITWQAYVWQSASRETAAGVFAAQARLSANALAAAGEIIVRLSLALPANWCPRRKAAAWLVVP